MFHVFHEDRQVFHEMPLSKIRRFFNSENGLRLSCSMCSMCSMRLKQNS
jgi:hypothetical protein